MIGSILDGAERAELAHDHDRAEHLTKTINVLAYVHLRNIHNSTGAGRVARQLTAHLAERSDINLQVLADQADYGRIIPQVGKPWDQYSYRFFSSDTSKQQAKWYWLNTPNAQRFWPEADIVFCTAESYVPKGKARLAVTVHDAAYFETDAHERNRAFFQQRFKWHLLYRKLAKEVDLFHSVSHFSAERLSHFFPTIRSRIRVVHNAVTPHFFEPVPESGKSYLKDVHLATRPFLLLPGGLHFRKNAELVLQAWPKLQQLFPELTLVVANHSDQTYVSKLQALNCRTLVTGFVSDAALHALYAEAQAVWFPSRYEGFGLPVVEAMACGTPVVSSNSSSLPEIAGDAALLVDPVDPLSHVEALEAVLSNSSLREDLRERGRKRAALFTWQRAAAEMKSHFESIL